MAPWLPPPELIQALPRATRVNRIVGSLFLGAASGFLVIGILILFMESLISHNFARLQAYGLETNGMVITIKDVSDHSRKDKSYAVSYIFTVENQPEQHHYNGSMYINAEQYAYTKIGQTIPVTYDPQHPENSAITSTLNTSWIYPYHKLMLSAELIIPIFGGISTLILAWFYIIYCRQKRLLQWGSIAAAVILDEKEIGNGRSPRTQVTYNFLDKDGQTITGKRDDLPSRKQLGSKGQREYRSRPCGRI